MDVVLESGIPAKQVIIQSFLPTNLDVAEARMPGAEIALLALAGLQDGAIEAAASRGYEIVSPAWPLPDPKAYVAMARARGLRVVPYTINTPAGVREAADAGVDGVITDDPLMALKTLDDTPAGLVAACTTKRLAKVAKRGRVAVALGVDERAKVNLVVRLSGRVAARARTSFDSAGGRKLVLRLGRRARKQLAGRRRAKLVLVATATDVAGNRSTARDVVRLR